MSPHETFFSLAKQSRRELTSKAVCNDIKDALKEGQEKHFEILYYRKDGELLDKRLHKQYC